MLKITSIYIYPIKGLAGISLQTSKVEKRGLQYDRRWLLVDENGKFLTQRSHPNMALLQPSFDNGNLLVQHKLKTVNALSIPLSLPENSKTIKVTIWDDTCKAILVGAQYDDWFSSVLNVNCRLVFMPDSTNRWIDPKYAKKGEVVSFADGYPVLVAGEGSLNDLNNRLDSPVPMNRFRPNLVFSGGQPFEEDQWGHFKVGEEAFFRGTKPCARCQVPTIDQETAEMGKEPIKTLSTFRRFDRKILFGLNACWDLEKTERQDVTVAVGDEVSILDKRV
jgi:uncharacterized protein YcbX